MSVIVQTIIVWGIVIALFFSLALPKKIHYFIEGLFLIFLGLLPILYYVGIIGFDISNLTVLKFVSQFILLILSKDLFKEAINEKESHFKWPAFFFSLFLLIITILPTLYNFNIISLNLELPEIVNNIIYIISGLFAIISVFTLFQTIEEE